MSVLMDIVYKSTFKPFKKSNSIGPPTIDEKIYFKMFR